MNKAIVIKHMGYIFILNGLFLFISFLISSHLEETSTVPLLFSAMLCFVFGFFPLIFVDEKSEINFQEGLSIVVFGWLTTCVVGMLPYLMWGGDFTLINAWFESVSGFTTTGSTILGDVESLPKGLLFWRSTTHWIGGVGIIIFVLLILPQTSGKRASIYNAEISSLAKMNFKANARVIVYILVGVYLSLTVLETVLLSLLGMDVFDAINHSFATVATGGFSTKNVSIAAFDSASIEMVISVFMLLSGIHFGLLYGTIFFKKKNIFTSRLVKTFVLVLFSGVVLVSAKLYFSGQYDIMDSLRYGTFQVVSLGTTTGFATADSAQWPIFAQMILIYFTIQCAMTGSTSGGLKFDRVFIFFKMLRKQINQLRHPRAVFTLKVDGGKIGQKVEQQVLVFIIIYLVSIFVTTLILTSMDIDGTTAFSASIATIGNVGPGLGEVGSMNNYADLPVLAKFVLSINMLLGRLEIFNIFALIFASKKFR
ncbi:MAG: TrkH family potassium uptake protein [Bacteroidota bacterium]